MQKWPSFVALVALVVAVQLPSACSCCSLEQHASLLGGHHQRQSSPLIIQREVWSQQKQERQSRSSSRRTQGPSHCTTYSIRGGGQRRREQDDAYPHGGFFGGKKLSREAEDDRIGASGGETPPTMMGVVKALWDDDTWVVANALKTVADSCWDDANEATNRDEIGRCGGPLAIVQAMERMTSSRRRRGTGGGNDDDDNRARRLLLSGCSALANLSYGHDENKAMIGRVGGIRQVLEAVRSSFPDDDGLLQLAGCLALGTLACSAGNGENSKRALADEETGGAVVSTILEVMNRAEGSKNILIQSELRETARWALGRVLRGCSVSGNPDEVRLLLRRELKRSGRSGTWTTATVHALEDYYYNCHSFSESGAGNTGGDDDDDHVTRKARAIIKKLR